MAMLGNYQAYFKKALQVQQPGSVLLPSDLEFVTGITGMPV